MTQPIKHLLIFAFLCSLTAAGIVAQDNRIIAGLEFEGLKQVTAEQALTTSGLAVGQSFKVEDIDAAAQKLIDSGLIRNLSYRTRTVGNKVTITFQIEEAKGGDSPVVFDNFIWFTDDQILEAIHREVQTFSGRLPNEGKLTDAITRTLQQLLDEHNVPGKVEYVAQQDLGGRMLGHVFSVTGIKLAICTFNFPGAKNISEEKLRRVVKEEMAEADYSREIVRGFAGLKLVPLYREVGQLQANFGTPDGKPDAKCRNGVEVTLPVSEGMVYAWDATQWSGMNVLTADQLNRILNIKVGDVANGLKFDKGVAAVRKTYGRQGYIQAQLQIRPEFDDGSQRVIYKIAVNEGPQYRMGNLTYKGLSERDARALRSAWRLKRGEVFDQGYLDDFFKEDARGVLQRLFEERRAAGKPPPSLNTNFDRHKDTLMVDVTLELTN